jgi:glutathione peroxidase
LSIYDFKVKAINGTEVSLDTYRGQVLLIVNTASKCGFTPQYQGLQVLYDKYHSQGFSVLGFPCNQYSQS